METQEEIWKDVIGYEGRYMVSNKGNIKSMDRICKRKSFGKDTDFAVRGKILKPCIINTGYCIIILGRRSGKKNHFLLHRLVATAFIPNPLNLPEVNHIDTVKTHNWVENLEWNTASQNRVHAILSRRTPLAENKYNAKLTTDKADEIRERYSNGEMQSSMAREFGVARSTICKICNGLRYKKYNFIS